MIETISVAVITSTYLPRVLHEMTQGKSSACHAAGTQRASTRGARAALEKHEMRLEPRENGEYRGEGQVQGLLDDVTLQWAESQ